MRRGSGVGHSVTDRRHLWLPILALSLVLAYGAWHWWQRQVVNRPLDAVAADILSAIDRQDANAILPILHESERSSGGLNSQSLSLLLQWYHDCIAGFEAKEPTSKQWGQDGYLLVAYRKLRNQQGVDSTLLIVINRTPGGPRVHVGAGLIASALEAKYRARYTNLPRQRQLYAAMAEGFEREGPVLRQMGITAVAGTTLGSNARSLEHLASAYRSRLHEMETKDLAEAGRGH